MKETSYQDMQPQMKAKSGTNTIAIAAIVASVIIALACIGGFLTFTIMVLDAIPFNHIFGF